MEKFVIYDKTANTGKHYISSDHSNSELEENAMMFDTEKEAQQYIDDNKWNDWACTFEIEI